MKTSIIISILLVCNTTVILAQPIYEMIKGLNLWIFGAFEIVLIVIYFFNRIIIDVRKISEIDMKNLNLFVKRLEDLDKS